MEKEWKITVNSYSLTSVEIIETLSSPQRDYAFKRIKYAWKRF